MLIHFYLPTTGPAPSPAPIDPIRDSINSSKGANSFLSTKSNSITKYIKCLKQVFK